MKPVPQALAGRCPICCNHVDRRNARGRQSPIINGVRYHSHCLESLVTAQALIMAHEAIARQQSADEQLYELFGLTRTWTSPVAIGGVN